MKEKIDYIFIVMNVYNQWKIKIIENQHTHMILIYHLLKEYKWSWLPLNCKKMIWNTSKVFKRSWSLLKRTNIILIMSKLYKWSWIIYKLYKWFWLSEKMLKWYLLGPLQQLMWEPYSNHLVCLSVRWTHVLFNQLKINNLNKQWRFACVFLNLVVEFSQF